MTPHPTGEPSGTAPLVAGTIVACNYLPYARVLAESFLAHHPGYRFVTLLVDGGPEHVTGPAAVDGAGEVVILDHLPVDTATLHRMAAMYTVLELSTALKPAFLQLLVRDAPAALYLDPDMQVIGPLHDAFAGALDAGIALTPHVISPMPRDGLQPDEEQIRHAGIFNLGFIGVSADAMAFLRWWHERLELDAVVDVAAGLFTDQRWIDWVPGLFEAVVMRDRGLNVAYWNLHERPLTSHDGQIRAGGQPLRLLHFSGYDPARPWQLSKHAPSAPRVRISGSPLLGELCDSYRAALERHGWQHRATHYGWATTPGGVTLDPVVRRTIRDSMLGAAAGIDVPPPDPFAGRSSTEEFTAWLDSPAPGDWSIPLGRWAYSFWLDDPGIRSLFPRLELDDAGSYQEWLTRFEPAVQRRAQTGLPPAPAPLLPRRSAEREVGGWNLVGYASSPHGVGEAGRWLQLAFEHTGLPHALTPLPLPGTALAHLHRRNETERLRFRDSIYCVNADMLPHSLATLEHPRRERFDARRVGLWFWELSTMPTHFAESLRHLEQVWVASEFTADAVRSLHPDIPVRTITVPLSPRVQPTPLSRNLLGLPDGFLFVVNFDFNSVMARKNPLDAIATFRRAFPVSGVAHLVVKTTNADRFPLQADRLRRAAEGRPDIHLIDELWSAAEITALHELADCYVSLHRSEGFGLNIADAMDAATPVIATGYSGNLQFCDHRSALLVPYTLARVGPDAHPYHPDAEWAQPDLDVAVDMMRHVVERPGDAAALAQRAQGHVRAVLSADLARHDVIEALYGASAPVGAAVLV